MNQKIPRSLYFVGSTAQISAFFCRFGRRFRTACAVTLCVLVFGAGLPVTAAAQTPNITLARNGKAALTIYIVDSNNELTPATEAGGSNLAAASIEDLRDYLGKLSGATFALETLATYPGKTQPGIIIGYARDLGFKGIDASRQQYGLQTTPEGQLIVTGADARGISHGIYALLHQLGCRWYYPGDLWSVTPTTRKELNVAADRIGGPDFYIQRRVWVGHGLHLTTTSGDFPTWCRRNGMAQPFDVVISHSWIGLDTVNDFTNHPTWFALVKDARKPSKPCYAHPEVIARAIAAALNHFERNPASAMYSVSAPDGLGFCSCELCRKQARVTELYESNGVLFGRQPDGHEISIASETIFNMANQVAKAVAAKYTGKRIGIMAYSGYAHPPSFKLEPNIYLEVTAGYRRTPLTLPEQMTELGTKSSALGVYEYYDVEQWSWDQPGRARASQLDALQAATRFYYRNNVRSVSGEMSNNFAPNGIGYYAIARLLWDAAADVREIEEAFYRDSFGSAAPAIKRLYRRWESGQGFDDRALALAYGDLDEAARLTQMHPEQHARVDRLRMYAHFLKNFLQVRESSKGGDIAGWKQRYGEEGALQRMQELGTWTSRMIDTHMIHGWAFNRYFARRGVDVGLDTTAWNQAGVIPSADEVEAAFSKDLAQLSAIEAREVPATIFSRRLLPLTSARNVVPGTSPSPPPEPTVAFRKATLDLFASTGETFAINFVEAGATYSLLFTPRAVYEDGGGSQYSTRIASGTLEGTTVPITAQAEGYYTLQWSEAALQPLDRPHTLHANQTQFDQGTFYFLVPTGSERFLIDAAAHGGPTLKVSDATGSVVLEASPSAENPRTRFLVEVPPGSDGAVWKVEGPNCINRTGSIRLIGVPPYLALAPQLLLAPREAIP